METSPCKGCNLSTGWCLKQLGWIADAAFYPLELQMELRNSCLASTLSFEIQKTSIKPPNPKNNNKKLLYLKGHHALYKIKLLQKRGEKGVCSHEHACIYAAYKIWHLKEYIYQLLAILKTLQHVSSLKVCNAYKKATVILLLSYFSKGPWQASHKIFSIDAFKSTQFNLKSSPSSAHIINRVIIKVVCGFHAFPYPSHLPF